LAFSCSNPDGKFRTKKVPKKSVFLASGGMAETRRQAEPLFMKQ